MYGDDDWYKRDSGASVIDSSSKPAEEEDQKSSYFESSSPQSPNDASTIRSRRSEKRKGQINGSPIEHRRRQPSLGSNSSQHSPPLLTRTNSADAGNQHFPLNDIDYQSSPAAVAQELSNLQAIRRMSMNVEAADPDLPAFGPSFSVPTAAPSHGDDEDDASRMFWVPAKLHPELAPAEFKTFVEDRVERIRKRSTDGNELSPDGMERKGSDSSLNRRKSMLSRTIDSGVGYQDGADLLERKRSRSSQTSLDFPETSLQDLSQKFNDPVELVRKMSVDSARRSLEGNAEPAPGEDAPILPGAPGGQSLKRSTRTNYRRGSLRKGERVPQSLRRAQRPQHLQDKIDSQAPPKSPTSPEPEVQSEELPYRLTRTHTEPAPPLPEQPDNFSRPTRKGRPQLQPSTSLGDIRQPEPDDRPPETAPPTSQNPLSFRSRIASNGRSTAHHPIQSNDQSLPQIVETPPSSQPDYRHSAPPQAYPPPLQHPERKSSQDYTRQPYNQHQVMERSQMRPAFSSNRPRTQTLDDMANSPSMMPGMSTRTDALTFIPSFATGTDEKKPEKKPKSRKDHDEPGTSKKGSWGWLLGQDPEKEKEKEKREKEKEREKEEKESNKKSKIKTKNVVEKPHEKPHDSTRLDVLSTTSNGPRGRESLVLDRESVKLDEERRKDKDMRKLSSSESKSTSASGIFSSLFGGSKKKSGEKDTKRSEIHRRLSPEPPPRKLRADVDYNWARFSILEERAIYRMAHLKLANPRRALHSQVLLSNFMYSYLAKVQQMHPQIQIPDFVQKQQGDQKDEQQDRPEQSDEYSAWQRYQAVSNL